MIIGAVIGKELISGLFKNMDPDIVSAVSGFGLFAISFLAVKIWSGRFEKKTEYKPVVAEILE